MTPDNWPRKEIRPRKPSIALRLVEVRERPIARSLVQPKRHAVQDLRPSLGLIELALRVSESGRTALAIGYYNVSVYLGGSREPFIGKLSSNMKTLEYA